MRWLGIKMEKNIFCASIGSHQPSERFATRCRWKPSPNEQKAMLLCWMKNYNHSVWSAIPHGQVARCHSLFYDVNLLWHEVLKFEISCFWVSHWCQKFARPTHTCTLPIPRVSWMHQPRTITGQLLSMEKGWQQHARRADVIRVRALPRQRRGWCTS